MIRKAVQMIKVPGLRWWIITLVFFAAVLNYVDRQTLSALAPTIQRDLSVDDGSYGKVVNLFLVSYTIACILSGKLVDKIGARTGVAFFVVWWSLASALTAFSQGPRSLGGCRFLLGLGQAGLWPAASKVVSEWFPVRERAFAIGIYTTGATIGAMLVPQWIIPFTGIDFSNTMPDLHRSVGSPEGWRIAFFLCGLIGLLWVIPWFLLFRKPPGSAKIPPASGTGPSPATPPQSWPWKKVLLFPPLWFLLSARLLTDPVWYFYQFWFAKFLNTTHAVSQSDLSVTWVLYAAAGAGSLFGGWLSGHLVALGKSSVGSRLNVMRLCACVMPVSPLIALTGNIPLVIALSASAVFCAVAWLTNITALVVDTVPRETLGTVFSMIAAGSTVGSVIMNFAVVKMITPPDPGTTGTIPPPEDNAYLPWFVIMAVLHPVAYLILRSGRLQRYTGHSHP